jgi:hypothetical protein
VFDIEGTSLDAAGERRAHRHQIAQQLDRAALLGRGTVVELTAIDFACEVAKNLDFLLKLRENFVFGQCCHSV